MCSSPPEFEVSEIEAYFSNAPKKVVYKEAEKKKTISLKPEQVQLVMLCESLPYHISFHILHVNNLFNTFLTLSVVSE